MKPITLHPLSLAIGFALAAGTLGLLAAQTVGGSHAIATKDIRVLGYVPAEQWTYAKAEVNAFSGVSTVYQVPADSYFVVTDFRWASANGPILLENGATTNLQTRLEAVSFRSLSPSGTRVALPPGTLISWTPPGVNAYAWIEMWGYLEPVR